MTALSNRTKAVTVVVVTVLLVTGLGAANPNGFNSITDDLGGNIWVINESQSGDIYDADGNVIDSVPYEGSQVIPAKNDEIDIVYDNTNTALVAYNSQTNSEEWNVTADHGSINFWSRNESIVVISGGTDGTSAYHIGNGTEKWTTGTLSDGFENAMGRTYIIEGRTGGNTYSVRLIENGTRTCNADFGNQLTSAYVDEPHVYLTLDHFNGDNNRNLYAKAWAGNCTLIETGDRATWTNNVEMASHPTSDLVFTRAANDVSSPDGADIAAHYKSNMSRAWGFVEFKGYEDTELFYTGDYLLFVNETHIARHDDSDGSLVWRKELDPTGYTGVEFVWASAVSSEELTLDVDSFMEHNATQAYTVTFTVTNGTTGETTESDVSAEANVTSSNSSVVAVDESQQILSSTSDTSINAEVQITATHEGLTATRNVTVSTLSVDNLEILPDAITRVGALFGNAPNADGDRPGGTQLTMQVLLVATMVGVAATVAASAFAGIGAMTIVLAMGWSQGWVGDGVMLGAVFTGLFIGLNLATNVDYSIRR